MSIYNHIEKLNYIDGISNSYTAMYNSIFQVSSPIEAKYNKDLYEFELNEIEELFINLKPKTNAAALIRYRLIFQYINKFKHLRKDRDNPLYQVNLHWYDQFVQSDRKLISEDELEKIITKTPNAQDSVVFRLLFEGIKGYRFSELLGLKKNDIDWNNNTLRVLDSKTRERFVNVSDQCMALLNEALEQKDYIGENGGKFPINLDDEYVIRKFGPRRNSSSRSMQIIHSKIELLKKLSNNKDLTSKALQYSGMAKKAVDVSKKYNIPVNEFLHGEHWKEVADQFNLKPIDNGGYDYYLTIRENLRPNDYEVIRELYGEFENYKIENFLLVNDNEVEHTEIKRKRRIDSDKFREWALEAYEEKCAITGESFRGILEACHIQPYINEKSNHIQNSILLRIDIHELFDSGYITIDESYTVKVSPALKSQYYQGFNEKKIHLPKNPLFHPSIDAIKYNSSIFKK